MLNFRKLKQDFASSIVKEGKTLYEKQKVVSAKLVHLDTKTMRIVAKVLGQFDNCYESEIEIDRIDCETVDSDCDCPYNHDCQHLAALLFYLEENIDKILVSFSKENDLMHKEEDGSREERKKLLEKIKEAESKEEQRQEEQYQRQVLQEYQTASELLARSPFFRKIEQVVPDEAELMLIFASIADPQSKSLVEMHFALRLASRSKPLYIPHAKFFFDAIRYQEALFIGGKKYHFAKESFPLSQQTVIEMLCAQVRFAENPSSERGFRVVQMEWEAVGMLLAHLYDAAAAHYHQGLNCDEEEPLPLLGIYESNLENPLRFSVRPAAFRFCLEHIPPPTSKMLINPLLVLGEECIPFEEVRFFECAKPALLYKGVYYRFHSNITRTHLINVKPIREMTIPEPLFGTFVENALPELISYAEIADQKAIESFTTIPFAQEVRAICDLTYLDAELDAVVHFEYGGQKIPACADQLLYPQASCFVTKKGVLARNLVEEQKILEDLFSDFVFQKETGVYVCKSDKKIVEFMTDVIPRNQAKVTFNCPQNLLDQFIYDQTQFTLKLQDTSRIDLYEIELTVDGALKGVRLDQLWECLGARRSFIELNTGKKGKSRGFKILVLDLDRLQGVIQLFDEMGIEVLDNHTLERPLWSLANIDASVFAGMPVQFSMSDKLMEIRSQMLGEKPMIFSPVPKEIKATLRPYQLEGVRWLERLRSMFLSGILADDMGLGKTLQAIVALAQYRGLVRNKTLIVCPTSLLYNWKEELAKFNPKFKVSVIDGAPLQRKKSIDQSDSYDVLITSYTLLQKDVEYYRAYTFSYVILDEAQHIKNRGTRNAKSVKLVLAEQRLILSGTPIENSLDELWSLFDFLMPGFLGTYERFLEKYIRVSGKEQTKNLEYLRKKVSPFILRRMKVDVLDDLPPVSELVYHCQLSSVQQELYRSYAESARNELVKLVEKEGFDRVQIHVLATLTRLKQICCHPAIFAKEKAEVGDSAKYEMLLELLQTLMEGGHKTVIFSQYTKMLQIMSEDFLAKGIRFSYLDGSSSNRLETVKHFNEDKSIPVFLVSLKAGGTGLNLVGADTVIHYDMWWNPAVESQATDRVHRMGQKNSVSAYKLITLNTIEEKIAEMQKRKKGLVKKVVSCDDEAIAKLTWEDVLELLKT
jgi:superfamily II DNA or RNA helicase